MKVLLAVDDESFGTAIVDFTTHHQWTLGTEFKVVNVIAPIIAYTTFAAVPDLMQDLRKESRKAGDALVRKIAIQMRDVLHDSNVEEVVVEGHPAEEILAMAKQWQADLILIGSHGRRGISRLFLGSVSMAVVSHAPCSVLVIRLSGAEESDNTSKANTANRTVVPTA